MTPTYRIIPYAEAHAASERGERVEVRGDCSPNVKEWKPVIAFFKNLSEAESNQLGYQFRILDPYAELKAAKEEGKTIQALALISKEWIDLDGPINWVFPPDRYRVKPDPKPAELVIEPGKEYRTRDGRKARIYTTESGHYSYPIHGAILNSEGWYVCAWMASGAFEAKFLPNDEGGDPEDLIAPWTDTPAPYDNWDRGGVPSWAMWQFRNSEGVWYFAKEEPPRSRQSFQLVGLGYGELPPEYAPTNFTGTWQTSLQQRPTENK